MVSDEQCTTLQESVSTYPTINNVLLGESVVTLGEERVNVELYELEERVFSRLELPWIVLHPEIIENGGEDLCLNSGLRPARDRVVLERLAIVIALVVVAAVFIAVGVVASAVLRLLLRAILLALLPSSLLGYLGYGKTLVEKRISDIYKHEYSSGLTHRGLGSTLAKCDIT